ncbi:MAG: hypothetical protein HY736_08085 [Verrucomicrobia bacterium]|nr:hypothetical protein [Verrucomicrobiota bacterium]
MKDLDDITGAVVEAALQLHRDLGPGFLESVYEAVLARALEKRGRLILQITFGHGCPEAEIAIINQTPSDFPAWFCWPAERQPYTI